MHTVQPSIFFVCLFYRCLVKELTHISSEETFCSQNKLSPVVNAFFSQHFTLPFVASLPHAPIMLLYSSITYPEMKHKLLIKKCSIVSKEAWKTVGEIFLRMNPSSKGYFIKFHTKIPKSTFNLKHKFIYGRIESTDTYVSKEKRGSERSTIIILEKKKW